MERFPAVIGIGQSLNGFRGRADDPVIDIACAEVAAVDILLLPVGLDDQDVLSGQGFGMQGKLDNPQGDPDSHGSPCPELAFDPDGTFHGVDQLFDDAHADAVVCAAQAQRTAVFLHLLGDGHGDIPAGVRILDRIADDIDIDLPEAHGVAAQGLFGHVVHPERERVVLLGHLRADDRQRVMEEVAQ